MRDSSTDIVAIAQHKIKTNVEQTTGTLSKQTRM